MAFGKPVQIIPKKAYVGSNCSVCGQPQFDTPSGVVCRNGHGGAPSRMPLTSRGKATPDQDVWAQTHTWDGDVCSRCDYQAEPGGHPQPTCREVLDAKRQHVIGPKRGPAGVYAAKEHAASLKMTLPNAPVGARGEALALELPHDISTRTSDELGNLYAQFSSLASYAEVQTALADVERSDAEDAMKKLEKVLLLDADGANATERKAQVAQDAKMQVASEAFRIANAKYVLLQALFNGYDRSRATISREFSRRGLDVRG